MAYVIVGYSTGMYNKKFLGIKPCANCGKFSEYYLSKSYFRINLFWFIPIFGVPTGKYLRCANCNGVRKLTREEWIDLKEKAVGMPKKKQYRKAYEALKQLVIEADAESLNTTTIYSRLLDKIDFTDDGGHIRELVDVYLRNSQNAANIAAASAAEKGADAPEAIPAAETETTEAIPVPRTAEEVMAALASAPTSVNGMSEKPIVIGEAPTYSSVPSGNYTYTEPTKKSTKGSGWRKLWLVPAVLFLFVTLLMLYSTVTVLGEGGTEIGVAIITFLIMVGIPLALDILFFVLAFKKKN